MQSKYKHLSDLIESTKEIHARYVRYILVKILVKTASFVKK